MATGSGWNTISSCRRKADPQRIQLQLAGADMLTVARGGDLVLHLGDQEFRLLKPVAYQLLQDGTRRNIAIAYELMARGAKHPTVIGFTLGKYDRSIPLVIDPVLTYSESLDSYANAVGGRFRGEYLYGVGL